MTSTELKEKWLSFVRGMNERGFPLPTFRDPETGKGSVSLTLVIVSFNFCMLGMIGKASGLVGGIDPSQTLNLFMVCAGLYWGRKFQRGSDGSFSVESKTVETTTVKASTPAPTQAPAAKSDEILPG